MIAAVRGGQAARAPGTVRRARLDTSHLKPACYSGAGFTPELRAAEDRGEVLLVDLERLYRGS
ncbi:hypothetical protein ACWGJT_15295 [Streptomyces xantholiticus]